MTIKINHCRQCESLRDGTSLWENGHSLCESRRLFYGLDYLWVRVLAGGLESIHPGHRGLAQFTHVQRVDELMVVLEFVTSCVFSGISAEGEMSGRSCSPHSLLYIPWSTSFLTLEQGGAARAGCFWQAWRWAFMSVFALLWQETLFCGIEPRGWLALPYTSTQSPWSLDAKHSALNRYINDNLLGTETLLSIQ